jgi:hypothetical protein
MMLALAHWHVIGSGGEGQSRQASACRDCVDRGSQTKVVMNMPKGSRCDLVGFGNAGVWVALSNGDGTFQPAVLALENMGTDQGWQGGGVNPRMVADVTGK